MEEWKNKIQKYPYAGLKYMIWVNGLLDYVFYSLTGVLVLIKVA